MPHKTYTVARAQLVSVVATVAAITAIVLPRAVEAATGSAVNIVDPSSSSKKAKVTAEGRLHTTLCDTDSCTQVDAGRVRVTAAPTAPVTPYANTASSYTANAFSPSAQFTVPAGKRLVIESVSFNTEIPSSQTLLVSSIRVVTNGVQKYFNFRSELMGVYGGNNLGYYAATPNLRLYADGGTVVYFSIFKSAGTGDSYVTGSVSGYLV